MDRGVESRIAAWRDELEMVEAEGESLRQRGSLGEAVDSETDFDRKVMDEIGTLLSADVPVDDKVRYQKFAYSYSPRHGCRLAHETLLGANCETEVNETAADIIVSDVEHTEIRDKDLLDLIYGRLADAALDGKFTPEYTAALREKNPDFNQALSDREQ